MTDKPRPTFELAVDTRLLCERGKATKFGDILTDIELSELIGRDIRGAAYSNWCSARRRLLRQDSIVFGRVHKVGYQRLDDDGIVKTSAAALDRIRRAARRAGVTLTCVQNYDGLNREAQVRHNAALSLFGAIGKITQTGQVRKLEEHVAAAHSALPLAKTLEFFAKA